MLRHILVFEIRYWLRSWMLWIFLLIIAASVFGAASTDKIVFGEALSNTFRNSPYNIQNFYSFIGLITMIMAAAFVNSAAARDFTFNTYQIVFSTPMKRADFLLGRFLGATIVSMIPMLGVSLGILLAKYMPWVEPERWEAVVWKAHLNGILVFALPNAFIIAAILFAVAVLARNEIVSFVASLVLLAGYVVSDALLQNVERQKIGAILDPFGIRTFAYITRYWTVAEKNGLSVGYSGHDLEPTPLDRRGPRHFSVCLFAIQLRGAEQEGPRPSQGIAFDTRDDGCASQCNVSCGTLGEVLCLVADSFPGSCEEHGVYRHPTGGAA